MEQRAERKSVYRSHDGLVSGVCAGIAERFNMDAIAVRILVVLLSLATFGMAAVAYIALWAFLPYAPDPVAPYDVKVESAESSAFGLLGRGRGIGFGQRGADGELSIVARLGIAVGLMLLFLVVAISVAPIVSGTQWWQFWPLGLLILGLCLIVVPLRAKSGTLWHAAGIVVTSLSATMLPMSLGVLSWSSFAYAFMYLWGLLLLAALLFGLGLHHGLDTPIIVAAFCLATFCLATLLMFGVPGDVDALVISMPDGSTLNISLSS